jgi:hypothetical protein
VSTGYYPNWFKQIPGQAPYTLIYSTNNCLSGVPDCFSGAITGNKASLTITGAQMEDDADYYCALFMGSGIYTVIQTHGKVLQKLVHILRMDQPKHAEGKVKV